MSDLPLTTGDLVVAAILVVSGLLAFARGFIQELLSLFAWIGAFVAAYLGYPHVAPHLDAHLPDPRLANIVAGGAVFLVAIIALWLITRSISRRVQGSALNALDRSLGFVFGLVRGALLVVLIYIGLGFLWPKGDDQPEWLREARSRPIVEYGAEYLKSLVSADRIEKGTAAARKAAEDVQGVVEAERTFRRMINPVPHGPAKDAATGTDGYSPAQRSDMERLIDSQGQR